MASTRDEQPVKRYVLDERKLVVFERLAKGYSQADVARMLNVHESVVSRIVSETDAGWAALASSIEDKKHGRSNEEGPGVGGEPGERTGE